MKWLQKIFGIKPTEEKQQQEIESEKNHLSNSNGNNSIWLHLGRGVPPSHTLLAGDEPLPFATSLTITNDEDNPEKLVFYILEGKQGVAPPASKALYGVVLYPNETTRRWQMIILLDFKIDLNNNISITAKETETGKDIKVELLDEIAQNDAPWEQTGLFPKCIIYKEWMNGALEEIEEFYNKPKEEQQKEIEDFRNLKLSLALSEKIKTESINQSHAKRKRNKGEQIEESDIYEIIVIVGHPDIFIADELCYGIYKTKNPTWSGKGKIIKEHTTTKIEKDNSEELIFSGLKKILSNKKYKNKYYFIQQFIEFNLLEDKYISFGLLTILDLGVEFDETPLRFIDEDIPFK